MGTRTGNARVVGDLPVNTTELGLNTASETNRSQFDYSTEMIYSGLGDEDTASSGGNKRGVKMERIKR